MNFIETRGNDGQRPASVTFSQAILNPLNSFGGLYVPESLPTLGLEFLRTHLQSDYKTIARAVLMAYEIDIEAEVIDEALALYDRFDDPSNPVPVVKIADDCFVCELYHGPTRAFKDMALQPFGTVLSHLAQKRNEHYLILTATSGDTGPAALDTFNGKANVQVACIYPEGGTSDVQRLQMVTEDADNLKVIGIKGDFDDAQSALKHLLASDDFRATLKEKHIELSAANSVNFGRIIFQQIYHLHAYIELLRQGAIEMGDKVYLNVPSGNFGNALGGYYAMKMGLPVEKIIISSNNNNVLTDFIKTGAYDLRERSVVPTTSPAMDILKSSNIERILFDLFGAERTKKLMTQLDSEKYYQLTDDELATLQTLFCADYSNDQEVSATIKRAYNDGYLMDPHTATCFKAQESCHEKPLVSIIYSTAEWTKFSPTIAASLTETSGLHDLDALKMIAETADISIPAQIQKLFDADITQNTVIEKEAIEKTVLSFL